ncbi:MAG: hypothetical protein LBU73_02045 [Helicobacteraceae bacterium]|nr:hypothetical protein [Helicobacteraceae bacterium]
MPKAKAVGIREFLKKLSGGANSAAGEICDFYRAAKSGKIAIASETAQKQW